MKEQYLNPDFMYEFIREICHQNGYLVWRFKFAQYFFIKRPAYLECGEPYNYCYEAIIFRPKLDAEKILKERRDNRWWNLECSMCPQKYNEINTHLEYKALFFDIVNERFHLQDIEVDDKKNMYVKREESTCTKVSWPGYIYDKGIYYYAIHTRPRTQKEQFLRGKFSQTWEDCLEPEQYLYFYRYCEDEEVAKNCEEVYKTFDRILRQKSENLSKQQLKDEAKEILGDVNFYKRSPLTGKDDRDDFYQYPLFYTSNALELTIPIAEALRQLETRLNQAVYTFQEYFTFLSWGLINAYEKLLSVTVRQIEWEMYHIEREYGKNGVNYWLLHEEKEEALAKHRKSMEKMSNQLMASSASRCSDNGMTLQQRYECAENLHSRWSQMKKIDFQMLQEVNRFFYEKIQTAD